MQYPNWNLNTTQRKGEHWLRLYFCQHQDGHRVYAAVFLKFIYLFLAVLGLRFCARAFSSCGKRGPLFIAVHGPLTPAASRCGAQAPDAQAQQLWLTGPVAPRHVGSSQTRARTRVPCIGRQILNHCATREALCCIFMLEKKKAARGTLLNSL